MPRTPVHRPLTKCARDGCRTYFTPANANQRFCSRSCQSRIWYDTHRQAATHWCANPGCTVMYIGDRAAGPAFVCPQHEANPWAGRHVCANCNTADWTMPWGDFNPGSWRCVSCHLTFQPEVS